MTTGVCEAVLATRRINSDIMEGAPLRLVPCWEKLVSDGVAEPR